MSRRQIELLSLDVFGVALERPVLHPQDIHGLVAPAIAGSRRELATTYPSLRLQAEKLARKEAANGGQGAIGIADIGDHLADVLDANGHPRFLARQAIACELDVEQRLAQSIDPGCRQLHDDAQRRGIPVAFVADSYLPRDFVARLLHEAGLSSDLVLVSSHEGVTKASGELFTALAQRAEVAPDRIVHLGPDRHADVAGAARAGARGYLAGRDRGAVEPSLRLGLTERSGLDSVALALAADRLSRAGSSVSPADIGYYASGPLAVGFAAWVGSLIEDRRPDQVIFSGRSASLLHRLVHALEPSLPLSRLHALDICPTSPTGPTPGTWTAASTMPPGTDGPVDLSTPSGRARTDAHPGATTGPNELAGPNGLADADEFVGPDGSPGPSLPAEVTAGAAGERCWTDPALDRLDRLLRASGIRDHDRVLAVDLGWDHQAERWLREGLALIGRSNPVSTALVGTVDDTTRGGPTGSGGAQGGEAALQWAFGPQMLGGAATMSGLAAQRTAMLDALVPAPEPPDGQPPPPGESYGDEVRAQLISGILAFADDLRPWLALGERYVTAALVEPALRMVHGPTETEARLLGWLPPDDSDSGRLRRTLNRVAPRRNSDPPEPTD